MSWPILESLPSIRPTPEPPPPIVIPPAVETPTLGRIVLVTLDRVTWWPAIVYRVDGPLLVSVEQFGLTRKTLRERVEHQSRPQTAEYRWRWPNEEARA